MRLPTMSGVVPEAGSSTVTARTTSKTAPFGANLLLPWTAPTVQTGLPVAVLKETSAPRSVDRSVTTWLFGT